MHGTNVRLTCTKRLLWRTNFRAPQRAEKSFPIIHNTLSKCIFFLNKSFPIHTQLSFKYFFSARFIENSCNFITINFLSRTTHHRQRFDFLISFVAYLLRRIISYLIWRSEAKESSVTFLDAVTNLQITENRFLLNNTDSLCEDTIDTAINKFEFHPSILKIKEKVILSTFDFIETSFR